MNIAGACMGRRLQIDTEVFRKERRERGLTQSDIAASIGATQSAVSMFESGRPDALADDKVLAMASLLGVSVEAAAQPDRAAMPGVCIRKYCPAHDCPSHVAYVSGSRACLMVIPVSAPAGESTRCALCGEVLESRCPHPDCAAPVSAGAFCVRCGTAYISAPPEADRDPHAYVRSRGAQLRELHTLAQFSSTLTTRGAASSVGPLPSPPEGRSP